MSNDPYSTPDPFGQPVNPYASPQSTEYLGGEGDDGLFAKTPFDQQMNPWTSIWTQPRATIRYLLESPERVHFWQLMIVGGVAYGMQQLFSQTEFWLADALATEPTERVGYFVGMVLGASLVGLVVWVIFIYLLAWLYAITGRWLRGVGTPRELRVALAYSYIPNIWLTPLYFIAVLLLAFGGLGVDLNPLIVGIGLLVLPLSIWLLVIICKAIGEAHQFSAWRGFGTTMLAGLLLALAVGVVMIPFVILFQSV